MAFETQIFGMCEHQYQPVYEALAKILSDPAELGGSITVFIDGKPVIDLWGGYADQHRSKLWQHDTLCCQWSVGKPLVALLLLLLSDRGQLDLYAPVSEYWPEFSQFGKDHITIQQVMTHTDGLGMLPGIVRGDVYDWKKMVRGIEQAEREIVDGSPSWQTVAYGQMCGEIVKRVSGSSIGEFWRSEIAEAHGVDLYFWVDKGY